MAASLQRGRPSGSNTGRPPSGQHRATKWGLNLPTLTLIKFVVMPVVITHARAETRAKWASSFDTLPRKRAVKMRPTGVKMLMVGTIQGETVLVRSG